MVVRINPSILAADFANLERDIDSIRTADLVHVDVMDNHFVPNLTIGLPVVERLAQTSAIPLDVHLMIDDPDRWAPAYADAGATSVTFHLEAASDAVAIARDLRARGARAGVAIKPATAPDAVLAQLAEFDQVLVMTVEPGFGGQSFMADMMPKLVRLRTAIDRLGREIWLQVDGGIDERTIGTAARAGADTFVAGSAIFGLGEPAERIRILRAAATGVGV